MEREICEYMDQYRVLHPVSEIDWTQAKHLLLQKGVKCSELNPEKIKEIYSNCFKS